MWSSPSLIVAKPATINIPIHRICISRNFISVSQFHIWLKDKAWYTEKSDQIGMKTEISAVKPDFAYLKYVTQ